MIPFIRCQKKNSKRMAKGLKGFRYRLLRFVLCQALPIFLDRYLALKLLIWKYWFYWFQKYGKLKCEFRQKMNLTLQFKCRLYKKTHKCQLVTWLRVTYDPLEFRGQACLRFGLSWSQLSAILGAKMPTRLAEAYHKPFSIILYNL